MWPPILPDLNLGCPSREGAFLQRALSLLGAKLLLISSNRSRPDKAEIQNDS